MLKKSNATELWTEKYRPKQSCDLVGNLGVIQQLRDFLSGKTSYKSVLLSGSPGLGKTTMAHVLCKESKYRVIEFNASDTRSKSEISKKIKDTADFHTLGPKNIAKRVLVMDEIDGMSSDRGGISELGSLIKNVKVPVICICNDRNNPKMRTLAAYCLDLKLRKLMSSQILPFLRKILKAEGKRVPESVLSEIVASANGDIRYCLNTLQHICNTNHEGDIFAKNIMKKTPLRNIFDLASELFTSRDIRTKIDLYFDDYNFLPLFVHENYLKSTTVNLESIQIAANSLSYADTIDKKIHGPSQDWSLLPLHAFYSTILPTKNRQLRSRLDFPKILGHRSKKVSNSRFSADCAIKAYHALECSNEIFRLDVLDLICKIFLKNYIDCDIKKCLGMLTSYQFTKDNMENLCELLIQGKVKIKQVPLKAKRALTAAYKKSHPNLPEKEVKTKEDTFDGETDSEINVF